MTPRRHAAIVALMLAIVFAPSSIEAMTASPAPSASPAYGDLTHLEYTATGNLTATLVSPEPGGASDRQAATFEVSTVAGAGVEIDVNGKLVPTTAIGKRTIDKRTGETHYFFYGVQLTAGPNDVVLVPLGANSVRGLPFRTIVYGPGPPVRVVAKVIGALRADGHTSAVLTITAFDRWNHSAAPGSSVHVTILKGDAHFESVRSKADGASDATSESALLAPPSPGANLQPVTDLHSNPVAPAPVASATDAGGSSLSGDHYGDPQATTQQGQNLNYRAIGDTNSQFQAVDVVLLSHGSAMLSVVPGLVPGDVVIRATIGDVQNDVTAFIAPALRKPMVLGLVTAGVGSVPGVPGEPADAPEDANARMGRIALYGVGQLTKTAQATVAYDTADVLDENNNYGSFVDDPTERPYLTFGDASVRRDDALSRDHLYARIDDNRSSLLWGEFQADTGGNSGIGGYSELVDGARAVIAGSNAKLSVFQARNDIAYSRQVFTPTGLANLGGLLHPQIVVGSDTVTLVVLDRRTGAILSQTVLTRNVDYTLDYESGFLRFINPPLPFDEYFNPQQILITYEYGGTGANSETTGGRFDDALGKSQAFRFGVGYVNDATGTGNLAMLNEDVSGTLPGGTWAIGHIASSGLVPGEENLSGPASPSTSADGDAYRFSLVTALGANKINLGFDDTSQNFSDPFGGLATPGLLDYRLSLTRAFFKAGTITASFDHQQNNLAGSINSQSDASIHARLPFNAHVTATAGIDLRSASAYSAAAVDSAAAGIANQNVNPVATTTSSTPTSTGTTTPAATEPVTPGAGSAQAELGVQYKINKIFELQANRISNIGKNSNLSQPAETTLELDADVVKRGRVYVRQLWTDAPTTSFAAATAQLTGVDGARSSTAVGMERSLGANTDVDSEYVIDHTASGADAYAEMGVREKFLLGKNLKGNFSFQRASTFGGALTSLSGSEAAAAARSAAASGFDIYGLALGYATARFHASGQYQLRTGSQRGYTLDLGAAGALSPDVTAFVASNATSSGTGFNTVDSKVSVAVRPSQNDRSVTLLAYEVAGGDVTELGSNAAVLSLEELIRPTRSTEIAVRYAYKLDGDTYYAARSSLFGVRLDQRLTRRIDVAAETRLLSVDDVANAATHAFAVEGGYRINDGVRVAAGYNFSGSPDPALVNAPTRRGVYATITSVIDNIFGWGKGSP